MYAQDFSSSPRRVLAIRMDPNCAICNAPANMRCECEARGLEVAVRQAETRMMQSIYEDIKVWVREHARDYILAYFALLKDRRLVAHEQHMEHLKAQAYHYYRAPPHPAEVNSARDAFKRGIDDDWRTSVQRYPEVLEYFFSLVELNLPADDDPLVRDPPLSALQGSRKSGRRGPSLTTGSHVAEGGGGGAVDRADRGDRSDRRSSLPPLPPPGPPTGPPTGPPPGAASMAIAGGPGPGPGGREMPGGGLVYGGRDPHALARGRTPPPMMPPDRMMPPMPLDRRTPVPRDRRSSGYRQTPQPPPSAYYPPY